MRQSLSNSAVRPEGMYNLRMRKSGIVRLQLHLIVRKELQSRLTPVRGKRSFYWRRCRLRVAHFYAATFPDLLPAAPLLLRERLPPYEIVMSQIREWNRRLGTNCGLQQTRTRRNGNTDASSFER